MRRSNGVKFNTIPEVVEDIKKGKIVIVVVPELKCARPQLHDLDD